MTQMPDRKQVRKVARGGMIILYVIAIVFLLSIVYGHYRLLSSLRAQIEEIARVADVAVQAQDVLSSERLMVGQLNYALTFHDAKMMRTGVAQSLPNFKASYAYLVVMEGGEDAQLQRDMEALLDSTMRVRDLALEGRWEEAEIARQEMGGTINAFESRLEELALARRHYISDLQKRFSLYTLRSIQSFVLIILVLGGLGAFDFVLLRQRIQGSVEMVEGLAERILHGDVEARIHVPRFLTSDSRFMQIVHSIEMITRTLAGHIRDLETNVQEQEESQAKILAMVAEVGELTQLLSQEGAPSDLYQRIVRGVADRLDLLHVAIYILDETGDYLILRAASSERGLELLHQHYQVHVGEGVVGYVAQHAEPYVGGGGSELLRLRDVQFPETRAYMVLPLITRARVIGVLEIRCSRMDAFPPPIVTLLEAIASYVAFMLDNVRLHEELVRYRRELARLYGETLTETWRELIADIGLEGYRYSDEGGVEPVYAWSDEMKEAVKTGKMVRWWANDEEERIAVPLHARGLIVGVVAAARAGGWTTQWLETFLQLVAHLETALESALLFTESQLRAARERALGELSSRFAQAFDLEILLEEAVRELGRRFQLDDVSIFIGPPEDEGEGEEVAEHDAS